MEKLKIPPSEELIDELTWREQDVLELLAERMTNREIATRLHLAESTVKEYVGNILAKLFVKNRRQAVERALTLELIKPGEQTASGSQNTLPASMTSFVGREAELESISDWLADPSSRLLTLTGPPGTGKTRLALQAASGLNGEFNNGVVYVPLAPIRNPKLVAFAIANALGIQEDAEQSLSEKLQSYLGKKQMLLLLDNFEQVIEAAPLVVDLLAAAPGVKAMVTSREGLRVSGEQELLVPSLALPDVQGDTSPSDVEKSDAVALFIQRIQAIKPKFVLTEANAAVVVEVCRQLDGLPLAIELAAPHLRMFTLEGLHERLECRFDLLKDGMRDMPERQQTLRATIDWSYDLLEEGEQILLARLSVFQGSRTIEAVEAVCCPDLPIDVLDGLQALLNKNLIRQVEGPEGEPRFVLLETIHDYAREQLDKFGETAEIQAQHAAYFTDLAERAEPDTRAGAEQMLWLHRLEADLDNLRTALEWSLGGGADDLLGLRLVGALGHFWFRQGHHAEGQQWVERALEKSGDAPLSVRAALHRTKSLLLAHTIDHVISFGNIHEALSLYKEIGDKREIGWTLIHLSLISAEHLDDIDEALALSEEGLALLQEVNDIPGIAQALNILGELYRLQGDLERAEVAYEETLAIAREIGDQLREALQGLNLGFIAYRRGQAGRALTLMQKSLALGLKLDHKAYIACTLEALAGPIGALGQTERAARLIGAGDAMNDALGISRQPTDAQELDRIGAAVRQAMDEDAFQIAKAEGRTLSYQEVIALAMDEPNEN
jgi:predicted ATPase/DNA-binding CsgD family transcriptional regulator